jgi:DNA-directed RNA polymerase specialized sigma24 family protein
MTDADIEEAVSDVFLILWHNSKKVMQGKLKAYLGGLARNKVKEKMRKANQDD